MQKLDSRIKMQEYVLEERKKQLERKNKMMEILSNSNYISWLQEFTNKYPKFRDDDFLYNNKKIESVDLENIKNLYLFFDGIEKYAKSNYIYPLKDSDFVVFYRIKYNYIGYEVGYIEGQGIYYFCERTENIDESFIDYNDIINNKKQLNTDYINKRLSELNLLINYFYEQNIPYQAIKDTIDNALWNIENESLEKSKLLKKTI